MDKHREYSRDGGGLEVETLSGGIINARGKSLQHSESHPSGAF